jgi:hypothetical protein
MLSTSTAVGLHLSCRLVASVCVWGETNERETWQCWLFHVPINVFAECRGLRVLSTISSLDFAQKFLPQSRGLCSVRLIDRYFAECWSMSCIRAAFVPLHPTLMDAEPHMFWTSLPQCYGQNVDIHSIVYMKPIYAVRSPQCLWTIDLCFSYNFESLKVIDLPCYTGPQTHGQSTWTNPPVCCRQNLKICNIGYIQLEPYIYG